MNNSMSLSEKIFELIAIVMMIFTIMGKAVMGANDVQTLILVSFVGIMGFVIFFVCAFFPADWRLTAEQKQKIKDKNLYQANYRKILVFVNFLYCIVMCGVILSC